MPAIERTCKITGKKFLISELEQQLRDKFGVELPDIHPNERLRTLMQYRNIMVLYKDTCDLCKKDILSIWGESPSFPVYCPDCWYGDGWTAPEMDLNLEKPFFDQVYDLLQRTPHLARILQKPIINSDYCNAATGIKNCYMSFNFQQSEDCLYCLGGLNMKNCIDATMTDDAELIYDSVACHKSFQVYFSEFAINCTDSYFLYDCVGCSNCAMSTGLRHKSYVFMNEQLTKEEYETKIAELKTGSYTKLLELKKKFEELKKSYPKKYLIGQQNEKVSGNLIFQSKNIEDGYQVVNCEDCAHVYGIWNTKDAIDMAAFGGLGCEKAYSCVQVGNNSSELQFCAGCFNNCINLKYCIGVVSSNNSIGCVYARNLEYAILNKKYSKEEYEKLSAQLEQKMRERGEWEQMFTRKIDLFAYNESMAQVAMPLSRDEAQKLGYRWAERKVPQIDPHLVYEPTDNIQDTTWEDVAQKVLICTETQRPYKVIKQEFDFYKNNAIPLPRVHPEIRMLRRYMSDSIFNLHKSNCIKCGTEFETSMPESEKLLCEKCYLEAVR